MKKILRISGYKDYVAVDNLDEKGNVLSTPIYIQKGKVTQLKSHDIEDGKWLLTNVTFDGERLLCHSISDNFNWESPIEELIDNNIFKPI